MRVRLAVAVAGSLALAAGCGGGGGGKHDADASDARDASTTETFIETSPPPMEDAALDADASLDGGADANDAAAADADASGDALASDAPDGRDGGGDADGGRDATDAAVEADAPTLCDMALSTLTVPSGPVAGILSGASRNSFVSCSGFQSTAGPEAIYALKIEETGLFEVRVDSDESVAIAIRSDKCIDGVSELACATSGNVPVETPGADGGVADASGDGAAPFHVAGAVRARLSPGMYTLLVDQLFTFAPTGRYAINVRKVTPSANASCSSPTMLSGPGTLLAQDLDLASSPAVGCGTSPAAALYYSIGVPSGRRLTVRATPKLNTADRAWMPRLQAFSSCAAATCLAQGHSSSGTTQQLDWINNSAAWKVVTFAVSADGPVTGARVDLSIGIADQLATCGRPTAVADGSVLVNQDVKQALAPDTQTCTGATDHALYYAVELLPQQTVTASVVGSLSQSPFNAPALVAIRSGCDVQDCSSTGQMTSFTNTTTDKKVVLIEASPVNFGFEPTFDLQVSAPPPPAAIFVLGADALVTSEAGGKATFQIKLGSPPTSNVTIPLSSNTPTEGKVSPSSLVFTAANWSDAQTVTVTGVDDATSDGARAYQIVVGAATSADSNYSGLDAADVPVTNLDDEAGVELVGASSVVTGEWGGTATFTVALNRAPTAAVHVPLATTNAAEGKVAPAELVFSTTDWNKPQKVTVTGVDDAVVDGTQTYTIAIGPLTSGDPVYSGLDPIDVVAHNRDDDLKAQTPKLLDTEHTCAISTRQQIATDAFGTIYVAVTCDGGVLVFASADGGATFSAPVTLPSTENVGDVRIAGGAGGVAYVAYTSQNGALFTVTRDGGATWAAPTVLLPPSTQNGIGAVRLASAGDVVFFGLTSSGNGPTSMIWRSTNAGRAFGPRTLVEAFNLDLFLRPDGQTLWIATDGTLRRSTDGGQHFTTLGPLGIDATNPTEIDDRLVYSGTSSQLTTFDLGKFGTGGGSGADGGATSDAGFGALTSFSVDLPGVFDVDLTPAGDVILLGDNSANRLAIARWSPGLTTIPDPKPIAPHGDNAGLVVLTPKLVATAFASGGLILFVSTAPP
jgi:hypothetical protein